MEVKELGPFVLMIVMVGMIIGIGVLVLDKTGTAAANTFSIINESHNWSDAHPVNLTMNKGNWTVMSWANEAGTAVLDSNFTQFAALGIIQANSVGSCAVNVTCLASYTYTEYDTPTRTALSAASTEIANISTNWLGLIITVLVLAIILTFVIQSFRPDR